MQIEYFKIFNCDLTLQIAILQDNYIREKLNHFIKENKMEMEIIIS